MLNAPRKTEEMMTAAVSYAVAANVVIYEGALVAIENGFLVPGKEALNLTAPCTAFETVDNTGGVAGAKKAETRRGIRLYDNDADDPITAANIGKNCFIHDDHTVSATNGGNTRSVAGEILDVTGRGVWVKF